MARTTRFPTHPRDMTLAALRASPRPLTAYDLLEKLGPQGVKSPPIVYRALEALEKQGLVHRIQIIGAYVACDCHDDHAHELSVLAVCRKCHDVSEIHNDAVISQLTGLRNIGINLAEHAVVELPVLCAACTQSAL